MNEAQQILFEKYIKGELDSAEKASFESRLNSESGLKEDFELFKKMNAFTAEKSKNTKALHVLQEVHSAETQNIEDNIASSVKNEMRFNFKRFLIIAAVLSGIAFFAYQKIIKVSDESVLYAEIMEDYYELPANKGTRSLGAGATKLDSAVYYFDVRDFDKSQQMFENLDATVEERAFYLSHIYFLQQDYKQCVSWIDGLPPGVITEDLIELKVYSYLLMGKEIEAQQAYDTLYDDTKNELKGLFTDS